MTTIAFGYYMYINSYGYILKKIKNDTLKCPLTLNKLITSNYKKKHPFIETLCQEIDYLDKFFIFHNKLSTEEIHKYIRRTMEDSDFFEEEFTES